MNINSMKGVLGDAVSNEVRTLELRVGQVVRGVVLQQFPNNEATVSINGVQVRAKLEIPIMEGQASLLQVQPDSKGGQVHLKQVDPAALGLQDPMKDIMKALSLPDKAWAQELIKDLRREGFALNKETAAAFQRAAQLQPEGISQEQWMNAAATAFKRGLPMTEATISAMHQLQNGTQLHSLLAQLRGQLVQMLANNNHPQFQQLLSQLATQLEQGTDLLRFLSNENGSVNNQSPAQTNQTAAQTGQTALQNGAAQTMPGQMSSTASSSGTAAAMTNGSNQALSAQVASIMQEGAGQPANTASAVNQPAAQSNQQGLTTQQLLPQLIKWLGVNYESALAKQLFSQSGQTASQANTANSAVPTQQQGAAANATNAFTAASNTQGNAATSGAQAQGAASQAALSAQSSASSNLSAVQAQQSAPAQNSGQTPLPAAQAPLSNTPVMPTQAAAAQPLPSGVAEGTAATSGTTANANAANAATQQSAQTAQGNTVLPTSPSAQPAGLQQAASLAAAVDGTPAQAAAHTAGGQSTHESLKATIMQLLQAPDLPNGVKETAQQLLHAITGQQLMLSPERNHSVLSHVTLFIPFQDGEGGQTASVHVQTRRNRKGELDSDNCRIVFDLQMKTLGPTLVDMNIVNKIVSLNLWNDHPAISPIVDALKPDVLAALQNHGYMLSSIKATPIPLKDEQPAKQEEGKIVLSPPDIEQLNSTRYKGVDFKV